MWMAEKYSSESQKLRLNDMHWFHLAKRGGLVNSVINLEVSSGTCDDWKGAKQQSCRSYKMAQSGCEEQNSTQEDSK
jgi:hypothetical protein